MKKWIVIAKGWLRASLLRQFVSLISLIGVLILVVNYAFISYYFGHSLLSSIEAVEADYMRMQANNIEIQMRNYRTKVYEAVLDSELLKLARQRVRPEEENLAAVDRAIRDRLASKLQTADIVAAGLLLPDGELIFHSRLKDDYKGLGWFSYGRSNYNDALYALCERANAVRNVQIGINPSRYPLTETYLIHFACPLFDLYTREICGTVVLSFNTRTLQNMTNPADSTLAHSQNSIGVLTDEDGAIIAHMSQEEIGKQLFPASDGALNEILPGQDVQILSQPLRVMGLRMYRVIDKAKLLAEPRRYTASMTLALSLILIGGLLLVVLTVRNIMRSVRALQRGLMTVRSGQLDVRVATDESSEIGEIVYSFNDMALRLKQNDEQRQIQERETIDALNRQRIAEIKALENQINSHFLYNTLNSINYTALACGNLDVSRQLKHLSEMLRYTFEKSDGVVTSEREAKWLDEYLALQKLRYGDAFDYKIVLDPDVQSWPMRKLMLQPFLENSLMHGFAGRGRGGWIGVRFQRHDEDRIRITLSDNGRGIKAAQMDVLHKLLADDRTGSGTGIGLENALLRIGTYYQGAARVIIRSWPGIGTKVVLLLPAYTNADR